jgi:hypothetical protein
MKRLLLMAACFAFVSHARADVLNPGQRLRVTFTTSSSASPTPDVLLLNFGLIQVNAAYTTRSASLYNGSTLLGTHSSSSFGNYVGPLNLDPSDDFKSPTSVFTFDNPAVVSFTGIQAGTIEGVIEFSIQTGQVDIPLAQVNLTMEQATGPASGFVTSPAPIVTCVSIVDGGPITSFCSGDGTLTTACPCANVGLPGHGCNNSSNTGGAMLCVAGATVPDSIVLTSKLEKPNVLSIFLQGNSNLSAGATFGDGVRCAGGALKRLYAKNADATGTVAAPGMSDPSITARSAALGDPIPLGGTRYYQTYYRDPVLSFCPSPMGDSWNVSSAIAITWQ